MRCRLLIYIFFLGGCVKQGTSTDPKVNFSEPARVQVNGYSGNIMEPFISRDGSILFFNNLNDAPENTNLHWAVRVSDAVFQYKGELSGVNTSSLEGVPTLDNSGNLYFVSNRDYTITLSTLYKCRYSNGVTGNVELLQGVSRLQPGRVNFDVEVSADGNTLYYVDGRYELDIPVEADLVIAQKTSSGFSPVNNSAELLKNVNTPALEYAAGISADELQLYFTRWELPFSANPNPGIFLAVRKSKADPFGIPFKVASANGFVEAPSVLPNSKGIYFHKKENGLFVLYLTQKTSS